MKPNNLILSIFVVPGIAFTIPEIQYPKIDLEKRAEMTYVQNWFIAGGAGLAGVGALASGIASIISATSSQNTCVLVTDTVEETSKRSSISPNVINARNATAVIDEFVNNGFNTNLTAWVINPDTGALYHEGTIVGIESSLSDITITDSLVNATVAVI